MYIPSQLIVLFLALLAPLYFVAWKWWQQEQVKKSLEAQKQIAKDRLEAIEQSA